MKVHAALAQALADHGVDTVFGLTGEANEFLVQSFTTAEKRRYVDAAHEAAAVLMAYGYASAGDRLGVATVPQGPGLTNTITPLVEAVRGRVPLLLITGDTPADSRNHPQDIDHREVVRPTGAGFEQARTPGTVLADLAIAIRRARVERRPVVFNVPSDLQQEETDYLEIPLGLPARQRLTPDPVAVDAAADVLATAQRPILLAGSGAVPAGPALSKLAERLGAPTATTLKARELFRGEQFDLGIAGPLSTPVAARTLGRADCLVVFGAGLDDLVTHRGELLTGRRVVQVEADPGRLGRYDAVVAGDPAVVARALIRRLDARRIAPSRFRSPTLAAQIAWVSADAPGDDARAALRFLDEHLPPDRVVVCDGGRFLTDSLRLVRVGHPGSFVWPGHFGAIGTGMGAAIGAALAVPGRPVVLVTGDGGFRHGGLTEFGTAAREGTDLIVVVSAGPDAVARPDLAETARVLGGLGVTVRGAADLEVAAKVIQDRDRPVLVDLRG